MLIDCPVVNDRTGPTTPPTMPMASIWILHRPSGGGPRPSAAFTTCRPPAAGCGHRWWVKGWDMCRSYQNCASRHDWHGNGSQAAQPTAAQLILVLPPAVLSSTGRCVAGSPGRVTVVTCIAALLPPHAGRACRSFFPADRPQTRPYDLAGGNCHLIPLWAPSTCRCLSRPRPHCARSCSVCPTDRAGPPPAGLTMMNGWLIVKRCPKDRSVAVGPAGQELRERASRVPDTPE